MEIGYFRLHTLRPEGRSMIAIIYQPAKPMYFIRQRIHEEKRGETD